VEGVAAQVQKRLFRQPMITPTEPIELRRKRLLWRSSHRGIKEMDLLMGGFAKSRLPTMTENELYAFEALIELPDQELLAWITGEAAVPSTLSNALLPELLKFRP
jgi:antitoxin CptB